jgi:hypothetical protein
MKVIASSIDQQAAVMLAALPKMFLWPAESAHTFRARRSSLARSNLQNNFIDSLDGGWEVCMIRIKKSH